MAPQWEVKDVLAIVAMIGIGGNEKDEKLKVKKFEKFKFGVGKQAKKVKNERLKWGG